LAKQAGIPAVVGTGTALAHLKEGQVITIDGYRGEVYAGVCLQNRGATSDQYLVTGTKILASVTDPHGIALHDLMISDGVGLLRGEFILKLLGVHPEDIVRKQMGNEYSQVLAEGLAQVMQAVAPCHSVYQLHDVGSADLLGMRKRHHDRHEPNPSMGYRGSHRLAKEPDVLALELDALTLVAKAGQVNFSLMLPMVRTLAEVEELTAQIRASKYGKVHNPEIWVKCETPALLIVMDSLCHLDIAGVYFDAASLTQFILGFDKENYQVAHHSDTADQAVEQALSYAIATCREHGVPCVVGAELGHLRPETIQAAVLAGATGLSVPPGMVAETRQLVAAVEQKLILDHLIFEHEPVAA
jgi:pyruvate,water dikinase